MIRTRTFKETKPLRNLFLLAVVVFLLSDQTSFAADSKPKRGWFGRLKMGNQVTRAMTYNIAKNERNAMTILSINGKPLSWFQLDDGVMGGQSNTNMEMLLDDGRLHFRGTINCNGGGFTSVRARLPEGELTPEKTGLKIRFRGDGKTYKVLLSNGERGGPFSKVPSWQADLPTSNKQGQADSWEEVTISFNDLLPAFGGGPRNQPSEEERKSYVFNPAEMKELGLMLSLRLSDGSPNPQETFGEGIFSFSLLVDSISIV